METQIGKKFRFSIKDIYSFEDKCLVYSDQIITDGCKWRLVAYPKGNSCNDHLSLYLKVANTSSLSSGWRRKTHYRLSIINQHSEELSIRREHKTWFSQNLIASGFEEMLPLTKLFAKNSGFLVNGKLRIDVEVSVLEVIGELDVVQESEEANRPLKKVKLEDNSSENGNITAYGFQIKPSQIELVNRIFTVHPDITARFIFKHENMKTASMSFLLTLVEMLRKSMEELTNEDLAEAENALRMVRSAGFKSDWLEKKLEEVKEKKKEHQIREARVKELEKELKEMKKKCSEIEPFLVREKAKKKEEQISRLDMVEIEVVLSFYKRKCVETEALLEFENAKILAALTSQRMDDCLMSCMRF